MDTTMTDNTPEGAITRRWAYEVCINGSPVKSGEFESCEWSLNIALCGTYRVGTWHLVGYKRNDAGLKVAMKMRARQRGQEVTTVATLVG